MNQNVLELQQYDTVEVARAMRSGGGFMEALAAALIRADKANQTSLYMAFGHEILQLIDYANLTKK